MAKIYGSPKGIQQSGNLYEHVSNYAIDSEGKKVLRYKETEEAIPSSVKKAKALTELQLLFATQQRVRLDPDMDDKTKREVLARLAKKYAGLSRFITPKDIERLNKKD